jgi:hypothetical protein
MNAGDTGAEIVEHPTLLHAKAAAGTNAELDALAIRNDAQSGNRTLTAIYEFLGRFVAYPCDHARVTHTLWIAHAHLMQKWDSTPRLGFLSPEPECGKTRALEVTELLVPNPVSAVNVTPAYLFRKVGDEEGATILFDEIDTVPSLLLRMASSHRSTFIGIRPPS